MKTQTTRKFIKNNFKNIYSIGYCNAQYLLNYNVPTYYTAGVNGWNADIYIIDYDTVIVTGYRPFGISIDYNLVRKYDVAAEEYTSSNRLQSFNDKKKSLNHLLKNLLNENNRIKDGEK